MTPIRFSVSYTLGEYLSFVRDSIPEQIAKERVRRGKDPAKTAGPLLLSLIQCLATTIAILAFAYKKSRVGRCQFTIDKDAIVRQSKDGTMRVPWTQVERVYSCSKGFLIAKEIGAMPLPYRCMTPSEIDEIAAIGRQLQERRP